MQLHAQTAEWPPDVPHERPSLNVLWLRDCLATGLPATLTAQISLDNVGDDWHATPLGLATYQVVSHLGFLPIPPGSPDSDPFSFRRPISPEAGPRGRGVDRSSYYPDMDEDAQRERAHWSARKLAFNMDYLSRDRNWGPFLAIDPDRADTPDSDSASAGSSDSDDPDWVPGGNPSLVAHALGIADKLLPDWSWLGAARVVAENTLRATQAVESVERVTAWDNLREGAWVPSSMFPLESDVGNSEGSDGTEETLGHDWAGAEGVWRYTSCLQHWNTH